MTKEISKEIKAKVFMLYPGAEVLVSDPFNPNDPLHAERLVGVINDPEEQFVTVFDQHSRRMYYFKDSDYKLILSDLSDISDEDLYAIAALCGLEGEMQIERGNHAITVRDWLGRKLILYVSGSFSNPRITDKDGVEVIEYAIDIIDFLRSRSYMLPAFGITDLFEAGIAVRKNKEV